MLIAVVVAHKQPCSSVYLLGLLFGCLELRICEMLTLLFKHLNINSVAPAGPSPWTLSCSPFCVVLLEIFNVIVKVNAFPTANSPL